MTGNTKHHFHLIVGARPNFMKADPVYKALAASGDFRLTMVHTGQHYDHQMSQLFFDELGMHAPDVTLKVGSASHGAQTARVLDRYEAVINSDRPDLIIVFGDVNSTIACALAAVKLHIPVAHVEAGLRSFDRRMPEEINRVLTDCISQLLFTTSRNAGNNLLHEGVDGDKIHFVGNTMIDSLLAFTKHFDHSRVHDQLNLNGKYILLTLHRPSNVDNREDLASLVEALEATCELADCVFPAHPRTRKNLDHFGLLSRLENNPRFHFLEPLGYIDFMRLQRDAALVLTDSGGIQGESTSFGVPCLTVRENTEHIVTLTEGTNKLIGINYGNIPVAAQKIFSDPPRRSQIPELWDGKSSQRIAAVLQSADLDNYFK